LQIDAADTCGVIKSIEPSGIGIAATWHGNVALDESGAGTVRLPRSFHAVVEHCMFIYQLTPVGAPAPSLHISTELSRVINGYT
jgi:hypothetical protein